MAHEARNGYPCPMSNRRSAAVFWRLTTIARGENESDDYVLRAWTLDDFETLLAPGGPENRILSPLGASRTVFASPQIGLPGDCFAIYLPYQSPQWILDTSIEGIFRPFMRATPNANRA